ncbi:MAG: hypothetical protein QHI38_03900 [Armatimonadota bacterium]|nr:hypothetical protein [Armatimonadota bacterium]
MTPVRSRFLVLAFVFLLAASSCWAQVKVITPSNMQDMILATVTSANAWFADPAPPGGLGGSGALFMSLGGDGSSSTGNYCGQVWLGTNAFAGVKLTDLTMLSYQTWCSNSGIWNAAQGTWSPPRQPCTLRLVINTNDPLDPTPIRMLMFRPIKLTGASEPGYGLAPYPEDFNYLNLWKTQDCLYGGDGCWAEFYYGQTPCLWTGTWGELLAKYPNATITIPELQVGGEWPEAYPVNTPNGCGLSLEWGAESRGGGDWPTQPWKNWWREALNAVGFVDYLQVGVGADYVVYDFEADSKNPPVAMNGKALQEGASRTGAQNWPFVVYGRCVERTLPVPSYPPWRDDAHFYLEDGSGQQIEVVCLQHEYAGVTLGKYYRVQGRALPRYSIMPSGQPTPMRIHTDAWSYPPLIVELSEGEPQ